MKNIVFGLIAIVTFSINGTAQDKISVNQKADFKSASLITRYEKEVTEYKFMSLVELNEEVEHIIRELDVSNSQNTCKVIVEIKVEIAIGTSTGLMSGLITVNCLETETVSKRLKEMILAAVTG